ncbi:MAG: nucleoside kinase [Oscillospiraceae bacterium]|nr:nucleoside kinase [Oscillospiraceae bacterium]MDY2847491.1 nucleoside kinase [Oscillospiraceae bacterium]
MNYIKTADINRGLENDRDKFIGLSENNYSSQLEQAAEKIFLDRKTRPIVLISGPSGSGKTTSALKIAELLKARGINVHTLSMDNYFLPSDLGELPRDENGNVDLESPQRLDIKLFSEHLEKIFMCEPVDVPIFDFTTQLRTGSVPLRRKADEIIIIEGIHALNPEVTGDTDSFTNCLYISVRTRIVSSDNDILHPRLIRLMRRLSRDRLFRGRRLQDVFEMFNSVSAGEELYIMPHKHRAAFDIDTFMPFEAAIYSGILHSELLAIEADMADNANYRQIVKFLGEIHPVAADVLPEASLIREFVGGSSLPY